MPIHYPKETKKYDPHAAGSELPGEVLERITSIPRILGTGSLRPISPVVFAPCDVPMSILPVVKERKVLHFPHRRLQGACQHSL